MASLIDLKNRIKSVKNTRKSARMRRVGRFIELAYVVFLFAMPMSVQAAPPETHYLNVADFIDRAGKGGLILDVRDEGDISLNPNELKGAQRLPASTITEESAARIIPSRDTPLLLFCNFSLMSESKAMMSRRLPATQEASSSLERLGYHSIFILKPGSQDDPDFSRLALFSMKR